MQNKIRYTLGKQERLKSRKLIDQLFKEGKFFSVFPIRVVWQYRQSTSGILQAGFTVSTKHFKKAVHRNRIKRLMKEAYRLQKNDLKNDVDAVNKQLVIFLMYVGKDISGYPLITEKINSILKRLQKIVHEENTANN
ncbi:ribonuclease P protein component [Ferruginibacter sp.]|uniref:ribonuclease P protein component n=1 Tax=Ferruginibacter sp. TaxID=1940288 RepID=UPI0026587600|nr:ribonuclease P protein component [Ferruginibacter sp.]